MRDASVGRVPLLRDALVAVSVAVAAAGAWLIHISAGGYAPYSDSALYIDGALHLGHGDGLTGTMGFPVAPSLARPFPFVFHPVGGLAPYALAAAGDGVDRFAIAFAVALAMYLAATMLLWAAVSRATGRPVLGASAALVFALDPALLGEATGVSTTLPLVLVMAVLTLLVARRWPPTTARAGAVLGVALAATHLVRIADPPLLAGAAVVLALDRSWRPLAGLVAAYAATSVALLPLLVPSAVTAASLLADTPGFEGFAPAQLDPPPLIAILQSHVPQILRKAAADLAYNVARGPSDVDAYSVIGALLAVTAGALRGGRRLALVVLAVVFNLAFTSIFFVGTRYLVHLLFPLLLAGAILLDRSSVRRPLAALLVVLAVVVFAADVRAVSATRAARDHTIAALVGASAVLRDETGPDDTILTDQPSEIGLYSGRWTFNIPAHPSDLTRLEDRIGPVRVLALRRGRIEDRVAYPDPAWRAAFASDRVGELRWTASVGDGADEIRIYIRP